MSSFVIGSVNHGVIGRDYIGWWLIGIVGCQGAVGVKPATDGDLIHSKVPMTEGDCRFLSVVLAVHVNSHMCGSHELLQGGAIVEVIVAWPQVRLGGQHTEGDVSSRVRHVTEEQTQINT